MRFITWISIFYNFAYFSVGLDVLSNHFIPGISTAKDSQNGILNSSDTGLNHSFIRALEDRSPDPNPPGDIPPLEKYCNDDLDTYCPDSGHSALWELYCLYEYKEELSPECQEYLDSTTIGACNHYAMALCPEDESIGDITACLYNQSTLISTECLKNLQHTASSQSNPLVEEQAMLRKATLASSVFAVIVCSMVFIVVGVVLYQCHMLYKQHLLVFQLPLEEVKKMSEVVVLVRACDHYQAVSPVHRGRERREESKEESSYPSSTTRRLCSISFYELSYYTCEIDKGGKQILHNITGHCPASSLTALMGPSGSGKTTLLNLLAGQVRGGLYRGQRLVNHLAKNKLDYEQIVRREGYIAQEDRFLVSLTVYETLLLSALLRLPQQMKREEKIARVRVLLEDMDLMAIKDMVVGGGAGAGGGGRDDVGGLGEYIGGIYKHISEGITSNEERKRVDRMGKGISGGQKRRLSIAIELLSNPSVLFLDEPTSGLDSLSTLNIVSLLVKLTHTHHTNVILTIHQPREEVFSLFHQVLLLGKGGHLVYGGEGKRVKDFLCSCPGIGKSMVEKGRGMNPGDFIIDLLGGEREETAEEREIRREGEGMDGSRHHLLSPEDLSSSDDSPAQDLTTHLLSQYYLSSSTYLSLEEQLKRDIKSYQRPFSFSPFLHSLHLQASCAPNNTGFSPVNSDIEMTRLDSFARSDAGESKDIRSEIDEVDVEEGGSHAHQSTSFSSSPARSPPSSPSARFLAGHHLSTLPNAGPHHPSSVTLTPSPFFPASLFEQFCVFSLRKSLAFLPTLSETILFALQLSLVGLIVTFTFSYVTATSLELPYQVIMLLSILSLYLMIIQYLVILPEYMQERSIVFVEMSKHVLSPGIYILSSICLELPRALLQTLLLYSILYFMHPLNPDPVNIFYMFTITIMGIFAWQALICLVAMSTDTLSVAYSILFLVLGSGTLFGGLLVRYSKIPGVFKMLYYVSIPAVTQRALIANDLRCCYLTTTCNSLAHDLHLNSGTDSNPNLYSYYSPYNSSNLAADQESSGSFCPPGLEFTGDGSDEGNLGRVYLLAADLHHEHPLAAMFFLLLASIALRCIAWRVLCYRQAARDQLKEVPSG